ncbi:MAG: flagellar hook-basal body complex protein [Alphaproteobacteria bacterium]|nr:flagellar hook-basal body complex protein [Alphaproteobacteria bacterium]
MDNSLLVSLSQQIAAYRSIDVIANKKGPQALSFVKDAGVIRDLGQGELTSTGATLDFAINGKGFFAVQTPSGIRYTRDGHFTLDQNGQLVTADGYAVQGDGGAITITPDDGTVSVGADGTISSILNGASNQIAKLQVVEFRNERAMTKEGANLYATTQTPTTATTATIAQHMLEGSNVRPVIEISRMVEVMRAYQMTATMTNSQEQLMRQAINQLGSMPN